MRLLDLFCSAGGAAMGLRRAGHEVVGVDIYKQSTKRGVTVNSFSVGKKLYEKASGHVFCFPTYNSNASLGEKK